VNTPSSQGRPPDIEALITRAQAVKGWLQVARWRPVVRVKVRA